MPVGRFFGEGIMDFLHERIGILKFYFGTASQIPKAGPLESFTQFMLILS
jgi:hypothetical protein